MLLTQVLVRGLIGVLATSILTGLIAYLGQPERVVIGLYPTLFAADIGIAGVLVTAMAVLGALQHLRSGHLGGAFKRTVESFRLTVSYAASLSVAMLLGSSIELTPTGWAIPALFLTLLGFVFLLLLLAGLVHAIADALGK